MDLNVPTIDSEGTWVLKTPYNTMLPLNTPLSCTGVSNYGLLVNKGVNVLKDYYLAMNLTEALYKQHFADGGKIIFVKTKQGKQYSFPLHYLDSFPVGTGVGYCSHGIGIRLQALPIDQPLDAFIQQIADLCKLTFGVNSQIETTVLSEVVFVSNDQHERFKKGRETLIEENTPALKVIYDLKESNASLLQQREIAERQVIKQQERIKELEKELEEAKKP